jgi:hypothetical protein
LGGRPYRTTKCLQMAVCRGGHIGGPARRRSAVPPRRRESGPRSPGRRAARSGPLPRTRLQRCSSPLCRVASSRVRTEAGEPRRPADPLRRAMRESQSAVSPPACPPLLPRAPTLADPPAAACAKRSDAPGSCDIRRRYSFQGRFGRSDLWPLSAASERQSRAIPKGRVARSRRQLVWTPNMQTGVARSSEHDSDSGGLARFGQV